MTNMETLAILALFVALVIVCNHVWPRKPPVLPEDQWERNLPRYGKN